ncbi:hypothetical protein SKAU_G00323950 [Synaphobranchus kaupii]|uniref:Uncharacterized protein n=1 Tax=Synaphobranchus kaupii TaxID=118154 RepID=A0A9Q1IJU2_SYNKA|nr:hypothetical protein SKAU_G00323950 [Synaphobranchus kaupii]
MNQCLGRAFPAGPIEPFFQKTRHVTPACGGGGSGFNELFNKVLPKWAAVPEPPTPPPFNPYPFLSSSHLLCHYQRALPDPEVERAAPPVERIGRHITSNGQVCCSRVAKALRTEQKCETAEVERKDEQREALKKKTVRPLSAGPARRHLIG